MTQTFSYPTAEELTLIAQQKLPTLAANDIIFKYFPIVNHNYDRVVWEQLDNYIGLTQLRGLGGQPPKVQRVGAKSYSAPAGVYGEYALIDEAELVRRRQFGTFNQPITINDLTTQGQDQLMNRYFDRMRQILWTLCATGTFSVSLINGNVGHTDTFPLQTFAGSNWSTLSSATPLQDLRNAALLSLGYSVNFTSTAVAVMNPVTANYLLNNTNAADIGGKRTGGFGTFNTMDQINGLLTGDDLPNIVVHQGFYINDSGTATRFIPNRVVVVFGARTDNAPLGEFQMTRDGGNADMGPGMWSKITDNAMPNDPNPVPREIKVYLGFSGGPAVHYPSGLVIMSV